MLCERKKRQERLGWELLAASEQVLPTPFLDATENLTVLGHRNGRTAALANKRQHCPQFGVTRSRHPRDSVVGTQTALFKKEPENVRSEGGWGEMPVSICLTTINPPWHAGIEFIYPMVVIPGGPDGDQFSDKRLGIVEVYHLDVGGRRIVVERTTLIG